jgi:hypothetical protein
VSNIKGTIEPFLFDVVSPDKDPGERVVLGKRRSVMKRLAKEQGKANPREATVKPEEVPMVEVAMFVRRMPLETQNELNSTYKSR